MHRLTSDRLELRPFELPDTDAIGATYSDPEVMRFVGHGVVAAPSGIERMLTEYIAHQGRRGFSVWAVVERGTGELLGDAGLFTRVDGEVELGYTLRRDAWGRGLATEAAAAWVRAAAGTLALPALVAQTDVPNEASVNVLRKVGFEETGVRMAYGREHRAFRLTLP